MISVHVTEMAQTSHPFYPPEMELLGYLANDWSVPTLLAAFAAVSVGILGSTYAVTKLSNSKLPNADMLCVIWFVFSTSRRFQHELSKYLR